MTIYDDMRGYVHAHDRNGWFEVTTETTPMYQMIDKAQAENAKLRTQLADATESMGRVEERCARLRECFPAEMGKNRGRICPTCGCIVFDDEECCPDCNAEVDG